jgi:cytidylate kinase
MKEQPPLSLPIIAIDGPAASGKSTIGHMLATRLGFLYLDTGCMYRAVTLAVLLAGADPLDESLVSRLAQEIDIDVLPAGVAGDGRQYTVLLNGRDVTHDLRLPAVDAHVSVVSSYPLVREEMVRRQREFGRRGSVVMVGRDIGTVVMPDAALKLYITASAAERAARRWHDRQQQGHQADYDEILADVNRRDKFDSNRAHSPLRPADDALTIDTTGRSPAALLEEIIGLVQQAGLVAA